MLRCEGLTKTFDGVLALDGVSLAFPASGIIAIIGPNGAGKTTLLNVLTGFLRPDAGRCFLGEREITIVEQKVREILKIARRVYVLRNGLVSFSGPTDALADDAKLREVYL